MSVPGGNLLPQWTLATIVAVAAVIEVKASAAVLIPDVTLQTHSKCLRDAARSPNRPSISARKCRDRISRVQAPRSQGWFSAARGQGRSHQLDFDSIEATLVRGLPRPNRLHPLSGPCIY